ncbi:MAG: DJ-1/PfpI family protein [Arenimonas sp.]|uniref:DJ-1/PfpI family protein n=1 Tax=Arenimonas sp. TaxID=1872635 RepID=UPI0025BEFAAA|nr:DJ-1/PfpI family protein [Arenimonas sp.]MBW8367375.1 DJ-1/PfpI family protein [Arenimonas sp.]
MSIHDPSTPAIRRVGILVFDDVEVLDFAGPFEVFAVTAQLAGQQHFRTVLVAKQDRVFTAVNGLKVLPNETFADGHGYDLLVVPGGFGTRALVHDADVMAWVKAQAATAEIVMSVCSGALVLATVGLLDGRRATTHHEVMHELAAASPGIVCVDDERYVDEGAVITCGGISAGIDGSLHVVRRLLGDAAAGKTAAYMEYRGG